MIFMPLYLEDHKQAYKLFFKRWKMQFTFVCTDDGNKEEQRNIFLIQHLEYIESVMDKVVIAGACPDEISHDGKRFQGSIIVYEADTKEEAISLFEGDPYFQNNIWKDIKILPWTPVAGKLLGGKTWNIENGELQAP